MMNTNVTKAQKQIGKTPVAGSTKGRATMRTSPRTGTVYPVAMDIEAGGRSFRVEPLIDDEELDARSSTGTLYWEGAVRVEEGQRPRGRGYLELTGYAGRLAF